MTSFNLLAAAHLAQNIISFLCSKACYFFMFSLLSLKITKSFSAQLSRELGRLGWTDGAGQRSLLVAVQSSQLRSDPSQVRNTHIHPRMAQRQRCLLPPQHQPVCRAQPVTCTAHRSGCCSWGKAQVCSGDAALAARCCRVTGQGETQFLLIARVLWCVTTLGKLLQRSWLQAEARILYKNTHIYLLERT